MADSTDLKDAIAIIGMAGRFPGAPNTRIFWKNLCAGVESIRAYTPDELREAGVDPGVVDRPGYVNAGAALDEAESFDAAFFGYHPSEAAAIDPQQRVFLECAWDVLEDAGYDPHAYPGLIGLFGGVARNTYLLGNLAADPGTLASLWSYPGMIASDKDYCTTRVAYKLDLRGPCIDVQTACSTSGVAIHLACQSLLSGECDLALAGGARVRVPVHAGYFYEEGGIPSPDGHCRAFDAGANGTAIGSGVAVVALRPLAEALRDRDHVYAVIRGSAINNDGSAKVGFTAPSVRGQAAVIAEALAAAGVEAESIGYVEAHGTGTHVGDPIEIAALTRAYRESTSRKGFCAIGSVKTNIGHLDAGAGVTGVIKTALALAHRRIPPSLNYRRPNPQIDFETSPFFVNTELREWPAGPTPRRAGVSAFGLGGNNSHIILEEAPPAAPAGDARPFKLVLLSAKSASALDAATARFAAHLKELPDLDLDDAAYTLQTGRRRFEHRRALVASDVGDALAALEPPDPRRVQTRSPAVDRPGAVFLFPGGGAQYPNMGLDLYRSEPVYREQLDRCLELLAAETDVDLRALLFPEQAGEDVARELERPSRALPTLFATEYALARLWTSWGIQPRALIGHSAGEYAAACLAGVISLEDALRLLLLRGRLFESLPCGAMLSVALSEPELAPLLGAELSLAAVNQPDLCVISGASEAIARAEQTLAARGVQAKRLHIAVAAHSHMIEPILEPFRSFVRSVELRAPRIPYVSNLSGDWIRADEATDPEYWVRHLRGTVRFADGVARLLEKEDATFLEVGPGRTLGAFTRSQLGAAGAGRVLPSLRHPLDKTPDGAVLLDSLGQLWLAGAEIDWAAFHRGHGRRRVGLPTYPFERKVFRLRGTAAPPLALAPASVAPQAAGDAVVPAAEPPRAPRAAALRSRRERILERLQAVIQELSGLDPAAVDVHASFLELGFESLFLTQASAAFGRELGVEVSLRQLIEDTPSLDTLAAVVDAALPEEALAEEPAAAPPERAPAELVHFAAPAAGERSAGSLAAMAQQLGSLAAELERISRGVVATPPAPAPSPMARVPEPAKAKPVVGPWRAVDKSAGSALSRRQQEHLDRLVARLERRCRTSKQLTQRHRLHLADARTVAGFRRVWKELVYPLVVTRSLGSKVWDVDGNEYVDIAMGFGVNMLGHSPAFVTDALRRQLGESMAIGPQTPLAGEVAELFCELTGMERAAFCNTGSEAVLAAIRATRTVTGRSRIATFSGDYHGVFDEVLGRGIEVGGVRRTVPVAPGIPPRMVEDTLILDYGDASSLRAIEACAGELAAVVVEPVQSRHPALQPKQFLHALAALTAEKKIPLVFDEMITGFRIHPADAQAWYGVRADIGTYGKVVAGGMPIGVVAGKARYLDALDGGMWSFGDDSVPEAGVTWFAGTFVRHPLALAAAAAVLRHLKEQGPGLQEALNERTARFAQRLNEYFVRVGAPLRIEHFSSFFLLCFESCQEFSSLFYFHLRDQGIHVTEGRAAFFSTAHSEDDFELVARGFEESVRQMQQGGFFPEPALGGLHAAEPEHGAELEVPLTEGQLEIWLAAHLGADASRAYNLSSFLRLGGPLCLDSLRAALQQLVDRHDALRARFGPDGDVMRIAPRLALEIPLCDLSGLEAEAREAEIAALRRREGEQEFDLAEGPLFRARVVRAAPDDHLVLLTAHHIVCDGWSLGVLTRELGLLYSAARRGAPAELPEPARFSDYARAEHEARGGPQTSRDEAYWVGRFADSVPSVELPSARPRPARKTYRAARRDLTLDAEVVAKLKRLGARHGCTGFTALLAGFEAFLFRLTGSEDLVVGISAAGQAVCGRDDLVGHCVSLLPLRFQVDGKASFGELARSLKHTVLDALDHQRCTFGTVVRKLELPRDPSRVPLVSLNFNLDPTMRGVEFEGLRVEVGSNPRSFENFDLFWNVVDGGRTLTVECTYNTDLFDDASICRRLEEFQTLLAGIVTEPERPLADLPLLPAAERQRLLVEWNATGAAYPPDACLHRVFEAQVERTPEAVALCFGEQELSYAELNARANRLARRLRGLGIGPEVLVGVCMERSLELVIALYAILKAGGAWVPLDPEYPAERLVFLLEDTRVPVLLTQTGLLERLPASPARVLCLDREADTGVGEAESNLAGGATAGNLAYVIYTSGSTGRPKGVMNEHRGIGNRLFWMQDAYGLGADDRVLQKTPFSFDVSVWEFFWPLQVGAALVLARPGGHRDAAYLHQAIREHGITTLHFVPSMLQVFLEEPGLEDCRSLRRVIASGEALPFDLMQRCLARLPAELHNLYGPTEAAVDVTAFACSRELEHGPVSIGRPVANTAIYVLDRAGQPLPVGVPGQLCIGGVQVARGYWNRPELTAEKFAPDPFSGAPGARLYQTGDLARWLPDGNLEYLGRLDFQVKIRGFRIELGEIEATLLAHPALREALVMAREDAPGDKRLVAYLVAGAAPAPSAAELRSFLSERLPEYMLPSAFVFLESLPLGANGKVERRSLPKPVLAAEEEFAAPRDALEAQLAEIWQELLGCSPIGVRDDFFELGGHSLLAVQVCRRIRSAFGKSLPVVTLFEAPTVAELAELLRRGETREGPSALVALQAGGSRPPFFFLAGSDHHFGNRLGSDQPVYRVQVQDLDGDRHFTSAAEMTAHSLAAIRAVQPRGPYYLGGHCFGGVIAFEVAQALLRQGDAVALLVLLEAAVPGSEGRLAGSSWGRLRQRGAHHLRRLVRLPGHELAHLARSVRRIGREALWRKAWDLGLEGGPLAAARSPKAANYRARRRYVPSRYPGRIVLFRCTESAPWRIEDPLRGWGELAAGGVEVHDVPGTHTRMYREPYVHALVEELRAVLERAQAGAEESPAA